MTTATQRVADSRRTINGLNIWRSERRGRVEWSAIETRPPTETEFFDPKIGKARVIQQYHDPITHFQAVIDPAEDLARLGGLYTTEFSPHAPDPLRDEFNRARAAGFEAWAAKLAAMADLRPLEPLGPLPLGEVRSTPRGIGRARATSPELREMLRRHANGDWGLNGRADQVELDDDRRWCPPYFGPPIQNAAAAESGFGVVHSIFDLAARPASNGDRHASPHNDGREADAVEIRTFLLGGESLGTLITSRRFDSP